MLVCAPIISAAAKRFDAVFFRAKSEEIEMTDMVGNIARWGSNALLIGMAVLTYAVFVLAR